MLEAFDITVENKLVTGKRDINVYHHATRSAHIISHNSSITLPLGTNGQNDYLHISVVKGPGDLGSDCLINLPSWVDFELISKESITGMTLNHSHSSGGDTIWLKIPPGPPAWDLKITNPITLSSSRQLPAVNKLTIGDTRPDESGVYNGI